MKKTALLIPLLISASLLINQGAMAADTDVLAIVNGKKITEADYNRYIKQRSGADPRHIPGREMVLQELISLELINTDAIKKKLDKEPEFVQTLNDLKKNQLAAYTINKVVTAAGAPKESEIKAEYERLIGEMSKYEYKARHVLVSSEEDAKDLVAQLDKGAKIEELAKEKSIDPYAQEGGDLGWFSPDQMETEFGNSVKALKKGEYTKTPVKTAYGWHVVLLEDIRDLQPPALSEVEEQIHTSLLGQRYQDYIKALRAKAKVEIK